MIIYIFVSISEVDFDNIPSVDTDGYSSHIAGIRRTSALGHIYSVDYYNNTVATVSVFDLAVNVQIFCQYFPVGAHNSQCEPLLHVGDGEKTRGTAFEPCLVHILVHRHQKRSLGS